MEERLANISGKLKRMKNERIKLLIDSPANEASLMTRRRENRIEQQQQLQLQQQWLHLEWMATAHHKVVNWPQERKIEILWTKDHAGGKRIKRIEPCRHPPKSMSWSVSCQPWAWNLSIRVEVEWVTCLVVHLSLFAAHPVVSSLSLLSLIRWRPEPLNGWHGMALMDGQTKSQSVSPAMSSFLFSFGFWLIFSSIGEGVKWPLVNCSLDNDDDEGGGKQLTDWGGLSSALNIMWKGRSTERLNYCLYVVGRLDFIHQLPVFWGPKKEE